MRNKIRFDWPWTLLTSARRLDKQITASQHKYPDHKKLVDEFQVKIYGLLAWAVIVNAIAIAIVLIF